MAPKRISRNPLSGWLALLASVLLLAGCGGGYETKTARGEGVREWFLEFSWGRVEAYAVWPPDEGRFSGRGRPAILLLHGSNARAQRFRRAMLNHARDGFFLMSVSLPGFGASTGPEDFAGPRSVEAVLGAVRHLGARPNVDKAGVFIYGVGQGASTAALAAAAGGEAAGLILENGFYDMETAYARSSESRRARIRTALGGPPAQRPAAYRERSAIRAAAGIRSPVLLLHGRKAPYPLGGAEAFLKALRAGGGSAELRRVDKPGPFASPGSPNIGKRVIPYARRIYEARRSVSGERKPGSGRR